MLAQITPQNPESFPPWSGWSTIAAAAQRQGYRRPGGRRRAHPCPSQLAAPACAEEKAPVQGFRRFGDLSFRASRAQRINSATGCSG